jgi:FSR family fosmidomycin resistance protein-like MFS transporter
MKTTVKSVPALLGLAHGVADGASGLLLGFLPLHFNLMQAGALVMLYNGLAFAAQPLFGYLADRTDRPRAFAVAGLACIAGAVLVASLNPFVAVLVAGVGSGLFHVGGGALTFQSAQGRASNAGVFASPGVLGLALGGALAAASVFPFVPMALGLMAVCGLIAIAPIAGKTETTPNLPQGRSASSQRRGERTIEQHDLIMIALLAGIALRSAVWTTLDALMHSRIDMLLMLGAAAFAGKLAGGFLADRIGWRIWAMAALAGAAVLLTLASQNTAALLLGVALLQSATPAALMAVYQAVPRYPATAAGLAFGLAIAIGGLPVYSGVLPAVSSPLVLGGVIVLAAVALGWGMGRVREAKHRERRAAWQQRLC